jgi:hypothetical protein
MNINSDELEIMTQFVHGLCINDGREFSNWGLSRSTRPAVYVEPLSYADVQAVVRDTAQFPTPVRPIGAMLSVTETVINDGGTLLCTRKLDAILGLETDGCGRQVVRVQAGCRLKKLNVWLQQQGWEIPFQAEIGEATIGSVAVGDTKESSLDGPGYFSSHVVAVLYIDEYGTLRILSDQQDGAAFYEFKCSFGLSGIVVECLIEVRPASLCRANVALYAYQSPQALAEGILQLREQCDALLAVVILHQLVCFAEQRYQAGAGNMTPDSSQPHCEQYRLAKRLAIQHGFDGGDLPRPQGIVFSRSDFVNEYWRPAKTENRLDFQYYEHDIGMLERVINESYRFTKAFQHNTGFVPTGWATYFVHRPEKERKPFGIYSGGSGISCSFDPIYCNPNEPLWQRFAKEYNRVAIDQLRGNPSPIQTQWLQPGDIGIPRKLARERFTTPYYEQFLM